ncbi:MAG: hypothetical protein IKK75_12455 [Clostridia bacterium]|nr:hypothetical protein [Clostridia bacterium]
MLKRFLALLLVCIAASAMAENAFVYTQESVTDCASTGVKYDTFYTAGELSHVVPGLKQDFVPQGLTYLPEQGWFLIAGYSDTEGVNSVIFAVDASTGMMVKEVLLHNVDGSAYTGHAGGIAATARNLFISNNEHLYRISLEKFLALPESGACAFDEAIPVPSRASYCGYADGVLWVGEFQYTGYNTDRSHYYKTEDGRHKAWLIGYKLDETQENELRPLAGGIAVPDYVLTTTERIQGMTVKDGSVYLSQSYGRRNSSELLKYRLPIADAPAAHAEISGVQVPLWTLTSSVQEGRMVMPPMSECLVTVDGAVYVLFESATTKYMTPGNASVNPIDRLFRLTGF